MPAQPPGIHGTVRNGTRVRQGEGGTLQGAYQSLIRLQVLLLVPGGVGLLLLARPVFALLRAEYVGAAPLVWILVPCLFLESLLTTAHNALIVYEHLKLIIISRLLTLVCVPLVIVLIPLFGIGGAALVATGGTLIAVGVLKNRAAAKEHESKFAPAKSAPAASLLPSVSVGATGAFVALRGGF